MRTAPDPEVVTIPAAAAGGEQALMRLRYGLNIGDRWRGLAAGWSRDVLLPRIRDAGTAQARVFLGGVDNRPTSDWPACVGLLEAIAGAGATPMIAIAQPSDWRDPRAVRDFASDCAEFVDRCCERWGREAVSSWYWSIGDEPNSPWTNGGLTFEGYKDTYETVAALIRQRTDVAAGQRPRIGGPSIDAFQPFWFDWLWRFVEEVDDSLIGFVSWNRYGEWRDPGTWSAPADPEVFRKLLMSRTGEYWSRSVALGSALEGRGILNICSELNAYAHGERTVAAPFNQGMFGAVYYTSALIELMRGGADGEFLWALECADDPYAALDARGRATPAYDAKRLVAGHIRFGDRITFPLDADPDPDLDGVVAFDETGPRAAILVHRSDTGRSIDLRRWPGLTGFSEMTRLTADPVKSARGAPSRHATSAFESVLDMEGYAVVLLS